MLVETISNKISFISTTCAYAVLCHHHLQHLLTAYTINAIVQCVHDGLYVRQQLRS